MGCEKKQLKAAPLVGTLQRFPGDLADQARRAAFSMVLNLAEGAGRGGHDRTQHFRVAYASALEAQAALELLVATGHLGSDAAQPVIALLDRVAAMFWRLAGK